MTGNPIPRWLVVVVSLAVVDVAGMEVVVVVDKLVEVEVDEAPPVQATVSNPIAAIPAASAFMGARLPIGARAGSTTRGQLRLRRGQGS
jgi:hypothetical protein